MMNLQVIHEGYINKIEKIISTGTVSCYPQNSPVPFQKKIFGMVQRVNTIRYSKTYNGRSV